MPISFVVSLMIEFNFKNSYADKFIGEFIKNIIYKEILNKIMVLMIFVVF